MTHATQPHDSRGAQRLLIGTIADDVTGGTDVAVAYRRHGLRTALYFGTPADIDPAGTDAVVIALKTRTIDAADAVEQSLVAAQRLRDAGAERLYFKYCSTFDSTASGNIGPVLDALGALVAADHVVTTPSSPSHGRTQYSGTLFVNGVPLAESPMKDHPLTPMRDSSLTRLMDAQSTNGTSTVVAFDAVRRGDDAVREAIAAATSGAYYLFPDALDDNDLLTIGRVIANDPLAAGGAGLAGGIAAALTEGKDGANADPAEITPTGPAAVLAGSCSRRTLEQINAMKTAGRPTYQLDALAEQNPEHLASAALAWFDGLDDRAQAPLIYSSLAPAALAEVQAALGVQESSQLLESALARVAHGLAERGITRFVIAGGETSGSVVAALGAVGGTVGAEAAPGVPWIHTLNGLDVLLKSGNFGSPDLLLTASGAADS